MGSKYVATITEDWEADLNFEVHELRGEYLSEPVTVVVTCHESLLWSVDYLTDELSEIAAEMFETSLIDEWAGQYDIPPFETHERPSDYRDRNGVLRGPIPYRRVAFWCAEEATMGIVTHLTEVEGGSYYVRFTLGFSKQERAIIGC